MPRTTGARQRTWTRATGRTRLWHSMRILRQFTLPDLETTAEVSHDNARNYVRALTRVGICRVARARRSGFKGAYQVWMLVRDLGPHAPTIQTDGGVWDPNAHQVHYEDKS